MLRSLSYASLSVAALMLAAPGLSETGMTKIIGDFSSGLAGWNVLKIDKKVAATRYRPKRIDGQAAVEASASNSMALLTKSTSTNLAATPILCWRWRVSNALKKADITKKSGDDQAARVYIGLDLPNSSLSLGTRAKLALARRSSKNNIPDGAINYVWDNRLPVGTARPNVYSKQAKIIVAQSGNAAAGQWVNERRNLAADIKRQFKTDRAKVISFAVASDTDNTGENVVAAFANIHMVAANQPCKF